MARLDFEQTKIFNDYIKHLNSLSTGSIVIMVTFMEKVFLKPCGKWLLIVSLICFLVSIIGGVLVKTIMSANALSGVDEEDVTDGENATRGVGIIMLWAGFLFGIISLGIFGIINLA